MNTILYKYLTPLLKHLLFMMLLVITLTITACGKKASPISKDTLNIPKPDKVEISIDKHYIKISNNEDTPVLVEKAEAEVGTLPFRLYKRIALLPAGEEYIDKEITPNVRYVYRLSRYIPKYKAYSPPTIKAARYRGITAVENIQWNMVDDKICITYDVTDSVVSEKVLINSVDRTNEMPCITMPYTEQILLVVIPYSDSDIPGMAYSESIPRDISKILLPPQNIKFIRQDGRLIVSWDKVPLAQQYLLEVTEENLPDRQFTTDATLHNFPISSVCVTIKLYSIGTISNSIESSGAVEVISCE